MRSKRESVSPYGYFWWRRQWGRPPGVVLVGTWLQLGVLVVGTTLGLVQLFNLGGFHSAWDVVGGILSVLLMIALLIFWCTAIGRITYFYYSCRDDEWNYDSEDSVTTKKWLTVVTWLPVILLIVLCVLLLIVEGAKDIMRGLK